MALNQPMLQTQIQTLMAAAGGVGEKSSLLATAMADAVITWCASNVMISTIDVGSAGSGSGTGKITVPLGPLMLTMASGLAVANGIQGPIGVAIMGAIAQAIGDHIFAFGIITTTNIGVGVGTGMATIVAPAPTLFALLQAKLCSYGFVGQNSVGMCKTISDAVGNVLSSSVGMVVIAGAGSPSPGTGAGTGTLT